MQTQFLAYYADKPLVEAGPQYPAAYRKANGYYCPVGAEPGVAYVLMVRKHLDTVLESPNEPKELLFSSKPQNASGSQSKWEAKLPKMYFRRATKITASPEGNENGLYLVELVDKRAVARMTTLNKTYNVRSAAPTSTTGAGLYYDDSLDSSAEWTWANMLADIWNTLPNMGSVPALPVTPTGNPEGFQFIGTNSWDALHIFLERIHCTTAYDPIADTFTIVKLGEDQSNYTEAEGQYRGVKISTEPLYANATLIPEKIHVYFHVAEEHFGAGEDSHRRLGQLGTGAVEVKEIATGVTGSITGTSVVLWDDLRAVKDSAGTVTNDAALTTQATARKDAWLKDRQAELSGDLTVYGGVCSKFRPGSKVRAIWWHHFGVGDGIGWGSETEVALYRPERKSVERLVDERLAELLRSTPSAGVLRGTLDADMAAGQTKTVSVTTGTGTDTGINVEVTDSIIESGKKLVLGNTVFFAHLGDGWYVINSKECPVDV